MKAKTVLRIAAGLALLHAVLHTIGTFGAPSGPAQAATVAMMKATGLDAARRSRSYWDFFLGFGLFVSTVFLMEMVLFWQWSNLVETSGHLLRPMLMVFCVGFLATAVISGVYFFWAPALLQAMIAACLAGAYAKTSAR